jgi:hypothetical protein
VRLAKLSEFRRLMYTPDSAPSMDTLRKHFKDIPGATELHGQRYVDLDEFERVHGVRDVHTQRIAELKKDPRLKGLV